MLTFYRFPGGFNWIMGVESREYICRRTSKWTQRLQKTMFHRFDWLWISHWVSTCPHTILEILEKHELEEI